MAYHHILLIDDDTDDHQLFHTALSSVTKSVNLTSMVDARVALEWLTEKQITPDVIFLDLNMPGMNGQQFLAIIKQTDEVKEIPVIVFTTSSHKPTQMVVKDLGAQDFITKPSKFEDLVSILRSVVL